MRESRVASAWRDRVPSWGTTIDNPVIPANAGIHFRRGITKGRHLSGDAGVTIVVDPLSLHHADNRGAVAIELGCADSCYRGQRHEVARSPAGDFRERLVVQDDVRGNALGTRFA